MTGPATGPPEPTVSGCFEQLREIHEDLAALGERRAAHLVWLALGELYSGPGEIRLP